MHVHKHQLYLLKQNSQSLKIWSAIIKFNTEGKSLNVIPHLHNLFLFQCDVTQSLNRYESPEQTVY